MLYNQKLYVYWKSKHNVIQFIGGNNGIKPGYKTARLSYPIIPYCCISNVTIIAAALQKKLS